MASAGDSAMPIDDVNVSTAMLLLTGTGGPIVISDSESELGLDQHHQGPAVEMQEMYNRAQQQQQGQQQPGTVQQQVGNDNCVNNGVILPLKGGVILPLKGGVGCEFESDSLDSFESDSSSGSFYNSFYSADSMEDGPDSDTLTVAAGRLAWGLAFGFDSDGMASSSDSDSVVVVGPAER